MKKQDNLDHKNKSFSASDNTFSNPRSFNMGDKSTTGKYLVLFKKNTIQSGIKKISDYTKLNLLHSSDFKFNAIQSEQLEESNAIIFDMLGIAVTNISLDTIQGIKTNNIAEDEILTIEPERIVYAIEDRYNNTSFEIPNVEQEDLFPLYVNNYLKGYRDAVNHLVGKILGDSRSLEEIEVAAKRWAENEYTWGLQATKVDISSFSGKNIKIAVLDTGFDLAHPDFQGRNITSNSFIKSEDVQDGHGHGTHCIGTACGPREPSKLPRYGIAYDSHIYAGKVMNNRGSGTDGSILAGIEWAINNKCEIVSMSLGAPVEVGQRYSTIFENAANRALENGTLIIAAAGNDSRRPYSIKPVAHPANCPSIMAVGAVDQYLKIAYFSSGGINPEGGQVDIAAPGVNVHSSWPAPISYKTINGTSMATPHVAGIAALYAEANPQIRGRALASLLLQHSKRLTIPSRDVGSGLVQAP